MKSRQFVKLLQLMFLILLTAGLSACWHDNPPPPPPAPDYRIVGELPTEIKVLQGTAVVAFKKVFVRRSGTVPATGATIPAPANVALGVGAMNPGIAVAFIGPAAGRPVFDVISQISIANTLARGTYPVVITGTAPRFRQKPRPRSSFMSTARWMVAHISKSARQKYPFRQVERQP